MNPAARSAQLASGAEPGAGVGATETERSVRESKAHGSTTKVGTQTAPDNHVEICLKHACDGSIVLGHFRISGVFADTSKLAAQFAES
jgi:hypothetical protein